MEVFRVIRSTQFTYPAKAILTPDFPGVSCGGELKQFYPIVTAHELTSTAEAVAEAALSHLGAWPS